MAGPTTLMVGLLSRAARLHHLEFVSNVGATTRQTIDRILSNGRTLVFAESPEAADDIIDTYAMVEPEKRLYFLRTWGSGLVLGGPALHRAELPHLRATLAKLWNELPFVAGGLYLDVKSSLRHNLDAVRYQLAKYHIQHTNGNVSAAARRMGMDRTYLYKLIRTAAAKAKLDPETLLDQWRAEACHADPDARP